MSRFQPIISALAGMVVVTVGALFAAGAPVGVAMADSGARKQITSPIWTHAVAWGFNASGQLGDGSQTTRSTPVAVAEPGLGFSQIAAGVDHSAAIAADGTVWTWGANGYGQLGDGTMSSQLTPVRVPGLVNIIKIAAGSRFTLAVRSDGTLWSWGRNDLGQLGTGTTGAAQSVPQQVPGLANIVEVAAGSRHSLVVRADRTVWAWGYNGLGQLGDGTETDRPTPRRVHALTGAVHIDAGTAHSVAALTNGTVWAWGYNGLGQLGDGTDVNRLAPVKATGLAHIIDVAAGSSHSLAVGGDGTLYAWGSNPSGQLGDGTQTGRFAPASVPGLSGIVQATAGFEMSAALRGDGTVWTCGDNQFGQLGDGTHTMRNTPVQVPGLTGVTRLDAGLAGGWNGEPHVLAIRPVSAPAFSIAFGQDDVSLPAGGSVTIQVTTAPLHGSVQTVHLATSAAGPALAPATGLPPGVTASFSPPSVAVGGSSTLTLTADPDTVPSHGESTKVTVTGYATLPPTNASATFDLLITEPAE
jgi:alpha-tubulin suppressor-like RCC1 family protein